VVNERFHRLHRIPVRSRSRHCPSSTAACAALMAGGGADFSLSAAQGRPTYTCLWARGRTKENRRQDPRTGCRICATCLYERRPNAWTDL
jgi:hypothetical protein